MIRRLSSAALLVVLASCQSTTGSRAPYELGPDEDWIVDVSARGGERRMRDQAGWRTVDELHTAAVEVTARHEDEWLGAEARIAYAEQSSPIGGSGTAEADQLEVRFGARASYPLGQLFEPYAGLGVAVVDAERRIGNAAEESEFGPGVYLHLGARMFIGRRIFVELDLSGLRALGSDDVDLDHDEITVGVGIRL